MSTKHHLALGVMAIAVTLCLPGSAFAAPGAGSGRAGLGAGLSTSKVTPGYLGIDIRDVTDDQVKPLKLKDARGAEIIDVDHDGPACKAGMELHDVILQMNGQQIDTQAQLRRMLKDIPAGRTVNFVISRNGQQQTISVQMANRQAVEREAWQQRYRVPAPDPASGFGDLSVGNGFLRSDAASVAVTPEGPKGHRDFLGMTMILSSSFTGAKLEVMGPQLAEYFGAAGAGLLVRSVDAGSPADQAGMKAGDVVVRVNQIPIASGNDWSRTVRENRGRPVSVVVLREKHEHTLILTPDSKKRSSMKFGSGLEEYLNDMGSKLVAETKLIWPGNSL